MILSYIFKYPADNGVMESFLEDVAKDLSYKIIREQQNVTLYVDANKEELINLSNRISAEIPLSLYLEDTQIKVVQNIPQSTKKIKKFTSSFTPKMIKYAQQTHNLFIDENLKTMDGENLIYSNQVCDTPKKIFNVIKKLAKTIKDEKTVKIDTEYGSLYLGLISQKSKKKLEDIDFIVMPTSFLHIEEMLVANKEELTALGSIERPSLLLRVNLIYAQKKYLPRNYVKIKMPYNLFLYFLSQELHKNGIRFFYITKEVLKSDESVIVKSVFKGDDDFRITILEDKSFILIYGKTYMSQRYKDIFKKQKEVRYSHYLSIIDERGLHKRNCLGIFLSTEHNDGFMVRQGELILETLHLRLPKTIGELLSNLESSSVGAKKLLQKYKEQFPSIFENTDTDTFSFSNSFYTLFGVVGVILGFDKDISKAAKTVMENSQDFGGNRGPRIDFVLNEDEISLNILKLVQSAMSFKLAGVDDLTLSFGLVESLSNFLSSFTDMLKKRLEINSVVLCGSMFEYKKLASLKEIKSCCDIYLGLTIPCDSKKKSLIFKIKGYVQGVGFRPFVYKIAKELNLKGYVTNTPQGVVINVEGIDETLELFEERLKDELPPLAQVHSFIKEYKKCENFSSFEIIKSQHSGSSNSIILPDLGICDDCKDEFNDKRNFRFNYPFINCTNCGPRYSIIKNVPYDRVATSMSKFKMCETCQKEYDDPNNRRYHAQPISCPSCGPRLTLYDIKGNLIDDENPLKTLSNKIKEGKIVALKGVGGFHIICDAYNDKAISTLRVKKNRPKKPFAIMCKDLKSAKEFAYINDAEQKELNSLQKPIVLLSSKEGTLLSSLVAPDIDRIGIFLPYSPMHLLLFTYIDSPIVATSANLSGEPIISSSKELVEKLSLVVEYYVDYDRDIVNASDDSVVQFIDDTRVIIRSSRGFTPKNFFVDYKSKKCILSLGSQEKNSISFYKDGQLYQSPYIGDMQMGASFAFFERTLHSFKRFYNLEFDHILIDKHPYFTLNKWAKKQNLPITKIQHHYAHIVATMFEHNLNEDVLGVAWDGTGYGDDRSIWGGEFFICDRKRYKRVGFFEPIKLLGGEGSIKNIYRAAFSFIYDLKTTAYPKIIKDFLKSIDEDEKRVLKQMHAKGLNSPLCSSVGRIFDIVASITLGLKSVSYDGQSGLMIEKFYDENIKEFVEFSVDKSGQICYKDALVQILENDKVAALSIFINSLGQSIISFAKRYKKPIVLSGGVFQNRTLLRVIIKKAKEENVLLYFPQSITSNDGNISLGQMISFLEQTPTP